MAKKVNPILTVRIGSSFRQVDFVSIGTPLRPPAFPDDLDPDGLAVASPSYIKSLFSRYVRYTTHRGFKMGSIGGTYALLWEDCYVSGRLWRS